MRDLIGKFGEGEEGDDRAVISRGEGRPTLAADRQNAGDGENSDEDGSWDWGGKSGKSRDGDRRRRVLGKTGLETRSKSGK